MNLANIARYWGRETPSRMALSGRADLSWAQLDASSSEIARGLRSSGISKGDRIAMLSDNCLEFCQLMVATFKCGAILVPLNVRSTPAEVVYLLAQSGSRLLIADHKHADVALAAIALGEDSPQHLILGDPDDSRALQRLLPADGASVDVEVTNEDVALICYTSGTTGFPKGAMLTHGSLWSMAVARILASKMTSEDCGYLPFSLSFTGGIAGVYMPLYVAGAGMVLHASYDAELAMQTLQDRQVTVFSAVPVIWEQMIRHPEFERYDLSSLRSCFSGGAPVPLFLLERLQEVGIPMAQAYGITEASGLGSILPSEEAQRKLGSAGRAILHSEMRIVDDGLAEVPRGTVGELTIRGANVMKGYWDNPESTAEALVDGWLRTGDLAIMDDEGFITLVDRQKDMLISGGLNVYPAEIEKVISAIPGVVEVAVIGIKDDRWGEVAAAVIVTDREIAPATIRETCDRELADYKIPRHVVFSETPLPRNASGKMLKRELRAAYSALPPNTIRLR